MIRIIVGFKLLNYKIYRKQLKEYLQARTQRLIENDKELALSQIHDNNNITSLILVSAALKTFHLIVYLLCISYFTGLFWLLIC